MSPVVRRVNAEPPWPRGHGLPEEAQKEQAPRRAFTYVCGRGGCPFSPFSLPFFAGAEPPAAMDCRCGATAVLEGLPEGTPAEVSLPGYGHIGVPKGAVRDGVTPMGQLRKRRSKAEGDAILAEALERVRQTGAAR